MPFSDLAPRAFDKIVERAHRERNGAIAAAVTGLLRWIVAGIARLPEQPDAARRRMSA
ncbi:MAG: hypothetical protein JNN33_05825 [Rhodospirillaceae bacterium]|nr:hypothetical protein [Rhodospirillaceae bacterium]